MGSPKDEERGLARVWLRDRNKSGERGQEVYVPEEEAPPSRYVRGFVLHPDGRYADSTPGATDRLEQEEAGTWSLEGDRVVLVPRRGKAILRFRVAERELIED